MSARPVTSKWVWVIKAMTRLTTMRKLLAGLGVALGAWLVLSGTAAADSDDVPAGRVAKPVIEQGKGDKCVEDEDFMRRNHMKLLKHQRDDTMHKGIRTTKYSLKQCIDCHASQKTGSVIASSENFCVSCHTYAAVKIDCFECHSGKPKATASAPTAYFHPIVAPTTKNGQPASHGFSMTMNGQVGIGAAEKTSAGASK